MSAIVSFREVDVSDAEKILRWRRQSRVADFLSTDVVGNLSAQRNWVRASYGKSSYYHWVFQIHGADAGLLSISDFDPIRGVTSWGYYIGEDSFLGLGAMIPPYLYNWLFRNVGLNKVQVEVFSTNNVALRMHHEHGYVRVPEKDKKLDRGGERIFLQSLELRASEWLKQRIADRFIADFPINRWSANPLPFAKSN